LAWILLLLLLVSLFYFASVSLSGTFSEWTRQRIFFRNFSVVAVIYTVIVTLSVTVNNSIEELFTIT